MFPTSRQIAALSLATVSCAATSFATPAAAQTPGRPVHVEIPVSSAGLDLNSAAGAQAFVQRIHIAAARACGGAPVMTPMLMEAARAYRTCKAAALSRAVADIRDPGLRSLLATRLETAPQAIAQR